MPAQDYRLPIMLLAAAKSPLSTTSSQIARNEERRHADAGALRSLWVRRAGRTRSGHIHAHALVGPLCGCVMSGHARWSRTTACEDLLPRSSIAS